ncbi:MAG: MFS transporter [Pararhodobacter sp.]|nr:MFS transporter [Pararhodobacter sp.]
MTHEAPAHLPVWPGFGLIVGAHCLGAMNLLAVLASSPLIAAELGLSAVEIGLIASVYSAALGALSIPSGRLADAIGVRAALFLAAVVMASGVMVIAFGYSLAALLGGMALCGAGYSLVNPAAGRAVLLWYPPGLRGTLMGIKQTGVPLGAAFGTGSAILAPVLGWQGVIGALAVLTALCGFLFLMLPRDDTTRSLPRMTLREEFAAIGRLFRDPVLGRNNLASGLTNGGQFILWAYLIEFLRMGAGFGLPLANACLSILHVASIGGRVFWGWLSDRALGGDSRAALLFLSGIALLGFAAMALVIPGNALFLAPLLALVLGATICSAVGVQMALTLQSARSGQAGGAIGYNMLATNSGGAIAPPAFGLLLEWTGSFVLAWLLVGAIVALAFGVLWTDRRKGPAR